MAFARSRHQWEPSDAETPHLVRDLSAVRLGERLVHPSLLFQNEAFLAKARPIDPDPFSRDWYHQAANLRHGRAASWLNKLLEFKKHSLEKVVCLGPSLGSDALEFARGQAEVLLAMPNDAWVRVAQRNFALQGYSAQYLIHGPDSLALASDSIDVLYWNQLNDHTSHWDKMASEILRVLRPGGKVIILAASQWNSPAFLGDSGMGWSAPATTRKILAERFVGSVNPRWHQRGLRRAEIPWLVRWLPVSLMQRLIGRCLIFKAFKPLPLFSFRNQQGWNPPSSEPLEQAI